MNGIERILAEASRIVVKAGSSLIVGDGLAREGWLSSVAEDVTALRQQRKQVVIVSSGAIALGRGTLKYGRRKLELEEKQAAAACGQITLISAWERAFEPFGLSPAQILLTIDDSEERRRYINARNTFQAILKEPHIVPIVNENDTVATAEIRIGDNDRLGARVAQMIGADLLILLSDIDGLYTADPSSEPDARFVPLVDEITPQTEAMAGGAGSDISSGGMRTKIDAGKIAVAAGCQMIIASGREEHPIKRLIESERGTLFRSEADPQSARKQWISGTLRSLGAFYIDMGARDALLRGKSLLPAGARDLEGEFERGDPVDIRDHRGIVIGKGLTEYSTADAMKILGAKTTEIESVLGYKYRDELIHRDNLVVNGASYANQ